MQTLTLKNTQQRTTLSQCHSGFSLINNLNQAIEHTLSDLDTPNGVQLATLQRLYNRVTPLVYAIMRTQDGFHGTFTTPAPEKKVLYGPESANAYYQSLLTEGYLSTSEQHAAEWLPSSENHIDTQDLRRVQQLVYGWMYQHNQNTSCAAMRTSQHDMIAAFMQARQGQPAPLTIIGPEQPPTATLYYDETLGDFAIQTVAASTPHTVATYAVDSSQQHAQVACVSKTRRAARPVPKTPQSRSRHRKKTSTKASKTIVFRSAHKQKAATHNTIAFSKRGAATRRAHTPARAMCFLNHNDSLHKLTAQRIAPLCSALRQYAALGLVHMDIPAELSALLHSSASTYRNAILRATEAPLLAQGSDYKSVCALTNPLAFPTDTGSAAWRATHMRFLNATNHQAAWLFYARNTHANRSAASAKLRIAACFVRRVLQTQQRARATHRPEACKNTKRILQRHAFAAGHRQKTHTSIYARLEHAHEPYLRRPPTRTYHLHTCAGTYHARNVAYRDRSIRRTDRVNHHTPCTHDAPTPCLRPACQASKHHRSHTASNIQAAHNAAKQQTTRQTRRQRTHGVQPRYTTARMAKRHHAGNNTSQTHARPCQTYPCSKKNNTFCKRHRQHGKKNRPQNRIAYHEPTIVFF